MVQLIDHFFLSMIPPTVTHQEHSITVVGGKPRVYEKQQLKDARQKLTAYLSQHAPAAPIAGPVRIVVKWLFPSSARHKDGSYKTTKPDTDNLQKLFKDCMTVCGFWKDDAQVASEVVEKLWSDIPGIYVEIYKLEVEA